MARKFETSSAVDRPPAPCKARRIEARRATVQREPRILERLTMGASAANIAHVEKITVRRGRRIVAETLAGREIDPPAGFVPLQIARLGDAMVVADTMMTEGDLQATECQRRALVFRIVARSESGPKKAPKPLRLRRVGHGFAFRDLSAHDGGRVLDRRLPSGSPRGPIEPSPSCRRRGKNAHRSPLISLDRRKTTRRRRRCFSPRVFARGEVG